MHVCVRACVRECVWFYCQYIPVIFANIFEDAHIVIFCTFGIAYILLL